MKALRMAVGSLALLGVALLPVRLQAAAAKEKAQVLTLKVSNLTKDTTKKDVQKLEKGVKKVKGVTFVAVIKKTGEVKVKYVSAATPDAIKAAVKEAGFTVEEPKAAEGAAAAGGGAAAPADGAAAPADGAAAPADGAAAPADGAAEEKETDDQ